MDAYKTKAKSCAGACETSGKCKECKLRESHLHFFVKVIAVCPDLCEFFEESDCTPVSPFIFETVKRLRLSHTQIQECRMCLEELALRCRNQQAQQTPGAGDGGDGGAGRPKLTKGQKKNLKKKNHKAAGAGAASN